MKTIGKIILIIGICILAGIGCSTSPRAKVTLKEFSSDACLAVKLDCDFREALLDDVVEYINYIVSEKYDSKSMWLRNDPKLEETVCKVTFSAKNITIRELFKEIEKAFDVTTIISPRNVVLEPNRNIVIGVENADIASMITTISNASNILARISVRMEKQSTINSNNSLQVYLLKHQATIRQLTDLIKSINFLYDDKTTQLMESDAKLATSEVAFLLIDNCYQYWFYCGDMLMLPNRKAFLFRKKTFMAEIRSIFEQGEMLETN